MLMQFHKPREATLQQLKSILIRHEATVVCVDAMSQPREATQHQLKATKILVNIFISTI